MDWGDGGFINDGINEEPQQTINTVSVTGEEKNKAIAAVSISQIVKLTRPNEGLVINGRKVYYVSLVAMVYEVVDITHQKIHLLLDDFTSGGPLEMNHIIGDSGSPEGELSTSQIKMGDYLRCVGVVKSNQDKPIFVAYNIQLIDDPNYITMHILEVIRDSLMYANRQPAKIEPVHNPVRQTDGFGKLSTREKHVLKFLQDKATSDEGLHIDVIAGSFKAFTKKELEDALATLSSEGFCWQGDTEELWCVNRTDI